MGFRVDKEVADADGWDGLGKKVGDQVHGRVATSLLGEMRLVAGKGPNEHHSLTQPRPYLTLSPHRALP